MGSLKRSLCVVAARSMIKATKDLEQPEKAQTQDKTKCDRCKANQALEQAIAIRSHIATDWFDTLFLSATPNFQLFFNVTRMYKNN